MAGRFCESAGSGARESGGVSCVPVTGEGVSGGGSAGVFCATVMGGGASGGASCACVIG